MSLLFDETVAAKGQFIEAKKIDITDAVFELALEVTPAAAVAKDISVRVVVAANPFDVTATDRDDLTGKAGVVGATILKGGTDAVKSQSGPILRRGEKHYTWIEVSGTAGANLGVKAELVPVSA